MSQASTISFSGIRYLNEKNIAEITGLPVKRLQRDRHKRQGLPYIKIGKAVRYNLKDVLEYMEAHKVVHEG